MSLRFSMEYKRKGKCGTHNYVESIYKNNIPFISSPQYIYYIYYT